MTEHEKVNIEIAQGVLLNIEAHGGPGAGLVLWAAVLISKSGAMRPDAVDAAVVAEGQICDCLNRL